ncbi:hypothetical protein HDU93_005987 [Gonapodya sp. JEL0774]|nr:hypothetical protein HDU93_005987 [Gonapodya sp. JEL0774]
MLVLMADSESVAQVQLVEGVIKLLDNLEQVFPAPPDYVTRLLIEDAKAVESFATDAIAGAPGAQSQDPRVAQILRLVQDLAEKVDKPLNKELDSGATRKGIHIENTEVVDSAKMLLGNVFGRGLQGHAVLPQGNSSIDFGKQRVGFKAKVHMRDSFVTFWN